MVDSVSRNNGSVRDRTTSSTGATNTTAPTTGSPSTESTSRPARVVPGAGSNYQSVGNGGGTPANRLPRISTSANDLRGANIATHPARIQVPVSPMSRLRQAGYTIESPQTELEREGRFSIPGNPLQFVSVVEAARQGGKGGGLASALMGDLACHPKSGPGVQPHVMRIFVPGLNTPQPEALRRTGDLYAQELNLSLVHLHNGSYKGTPPTQVQDRPFTLFKASGGHVEYLPGALDRLLNGRPEEKRDWLNAVLTLQGLKESPLAKSFANLLEANFKQQPPELIDISFYSDATIASIQGVEEFKRRQVERGRNPAECAQYLREAEKYLNSKVLIQLHGNACPHLPKGPRYLVWTDVGDPLTFGKTPLSHRQMGVEATHPDPNNRDAVYINYAGPFSGHGFESHNLGAGGMRTVAEILRRNQARSGWELWQKGQQGPLEIPAKGEVEGNPYELWDHALRDQILRQRGLPPAQT